VFVYCLYFVLFSTGVDFTNKRNELQCHFSQLSNEAIHYFDDVV